MRAVNETTGEAIAQLSYRLETGDGDVFYGETDEDGKTIQIRTVSEQAVKVWWGVPALGQDEVVQDMAKRQECLAKVAKVS